MIRTCSLRGWNVALLGIGTSLDAYGEAEIKKAIEGMTNKRTSIVMPVAYNVRKIVKHEELRMLDKNGLRMKYVKGTAKAVTKPAAEVKVKVKAAGKIKKRFALVDRLKKIGSSCAGK